jgi:predicted nuclease of restriction endonuclease-like (RecB) superfamily
MDEKAFQEQISELLVEVQRFPELNKQRIDETMAATSARHEKLKKSVASLQSSLDFLRLSIKYLTFDLEATKRENRMLRRMLEEGN